MKVYLRSIGINELPELLKKLHRHADQAVHTLVDSPQEADLILLCGNLTGASTDWKELVKRHPDRCAVYSDDDSYLPLVPGIYCSPHRGYSTKTGRVGSYSYIARHVKKGNPFITSVSAEQKKDLLFSFQGSTTSFVRKRLFSTNYGRPDVLIEDTTRHVNWIETADSQRQQKAYVETIARSHFVLCPRGSGTGSFRLFEVMRMGVAPVLLADSYVLPAGPDWDSFLIRLREREIARLPEILEGHRAESVERGRLAGAAWQAWFSTEKEFNQIVGRCAAARNACGRAEPVYRLSWPAMTLGLHLRTRLRGAVRSGLLKTMQMLGAKPPFSIRTHHIPDFDPNTGDDL